MKTNGYKIRTFYDIIKFLHFTMVELLVVIAIIMILASLLFPALQKARNRVKGLTCLNQQKQIGTAFFNYSTDYNGYIGFYITYGASDYQWPDIFTSQAFPAAKSLGFGDYLRTDNLGSTLYCPDFKNMGYNRYYCYGSPADGNWTIPAEARIWITSGTSFYINLSRLSKPSLLGGVYDSFIQTKNKQVNIVQGVDSATGTWYFGHARRCNTWFFDGHSEAIDQDKLRTILKYVRRSSSVGLYIADERKFTYPISCP